MSIMKDLSKMTAEKIIYTLETPREVRRQRRQERREQREPWMTKYFGMVVPLAVQLWRAKTSRKQESFQQQTPGTQG